MALSDYAHWNEDAQMMWWLEEGRHEAFDVDDVDYDAEMYDAPEDDWEDFDDEEDADSEDWSGPEDLGWDGGLEA